VAIKRALGHDSLIEPGKIGQFDVVVNGKTIFSKQSQGRFPETDEILKLLA
jgi:selT/selW/selH-like putative selenoprotein